MASTRIPLELFSYILAYGRDEDEYDPLLDYGNGWAAQQSTLHRHHLSSLSSVCVYWANFIRPRIFQILVLRSAQDLYGLLALLRMPCSPRLLSIAHYLRTVAVFYRFTDYFWCHNLQRLQANAPRKELSLRIHISGPAPCVRNKERTARHPLYNTIPWVVPFHRGLLLHDVELFIEHVQFPDGAGLVNLIRDINYSGILPRSIHCEGLDWRDGLRLPFASLDPKFPLKHHVKPFTVTVKRCTDDISAAFATYGHSIGHNERGASILNSSDANRFLDLCSELERLTCKADPRLATSSIESRAIHDSPLTEREGENQLSKADQGMAGYTWMASQAFRHERFHTGSELGFYMRPEQGHGLDSSQTAHIHSIIIGIYERSLAWEVEWKTILRKALGFPMLNTIKVFVHDQAELWYFVNCHREILAVPESQGRLRLYFFDTAFDMPQYAHWRQEDWIDIDMTDAMAQITSSSLQSGSEEELEDESESSKEDESQSSQEDESESSQEDESESSRED